MSYGVGSSPEEALGNLRQAKRRSKVDQLTSNMTYRIKQSNCEVQSLEGDSHSLYLFATSERADQYINSIGYSFTHYNLKQILLIGIEDDKAQTEEREQKLQILKRQIVSQLLALGEGNYIKSDSNLSEGVISSEIQRKKYTEMSKLEIDVVVIYYPELEFYLQSIQKKLISVVPIYDVTSVLKRHLVDIYSVLRILNQEEIFSFEMLKKTEFNQNDLIFSLSEGRDYCYVSLTQSKFTRGRGIVSPNDIEIRSNLQEEKGERIETKALLEKAIQNHAIDFARSTLALVIIILGFAIWIGWNALPKNWEFLEPRVELIPPILLTLDFILQIILGREDLSLAPRGLFRWVKRRKLQSLKKKWGI
jgi:hypothetical protein